MFSIITITLSVFLSFSVFNVACAEERPVQETAQETTGEAKPAKVVEAKELTKEETLERLNNIFQNRLDIREAIPGIKGKEDESGVFYEYNGTRLERLDRDTLSGLFRAVNQQISLKNYERLQQYQRTQQQLRNLQQIQQINKTQRMLRQQRSPAPKVPKVYTPPKTYRPPKTYKPPKTYRSPGR